MTDTIEGVPFGRKLIVIGIILWTLICLNVGCASRNPGDFAPDQIQAINRIKWK
ncbi:hypothetical protein [Mesorhizobium sp. M8A.F.Ca.ET.021.01.1.1]|uniref:hypothetical protein n=1 Tax=Mesorhizobium sp. M8A.F.Ca.ET.021.01.1.1 TaxID=2496757 RepID=UPI0016744EFE|nr:hypothetical protein [Mesorhizobium sp. M8A.F.Ca.ET.021.01.1.1]